MEAISWLSISYISSTSSPQPQPHWTIHASSTLELSKWKITSGLSSLTFLSSQILELNFASHVSLQTEFTRVTLWICWHWASLLKNAGNAFRSTRREISGRFSKSRRRAWIKQSNPHLFFWFTLISISLACLELTNSKNGAILDFLVSRTWWATPSLSAISRQKDFLPCSLDLWTAPWLFPLGPVVDKEGMLLVFF